jgi:hypothetical protein
MLAWGWAFACAYLPYPGDAGKGISLSRLAEYQAAHIGVCFNWETTGHDYQQGRAGGVTAASSALTSLAGLGVTGPAVVYFTPADTDLSGNMAAQQALADYLDGAASVLGLERVGIYQNAAICQAMQLHASYFWQTYAWSGGVQWPGANLFQYLNDVNVGGYNVDHDRTVKSDVDYGQWPRPTIEPPVTIPEGTSAMLWQDSQGGMWWTDIGSKSTMSIGTGTRMGTGPNSQPVFISETQATDTWMLDTFPQIR